MEYLEIEGGRPLQGQVTIQGSKNAVLPMLSAALLHTGKTTLYHCPKIRDVEVMLEILQGLGCEYGWEEDRLWIEAKTVVESQIPAKLAEQMRSSITLLGSLLARTGQAHIPYPGGCVIGARPIDLHVEGLKEMGVVFQNTEDEVHALGMELHGAEIDLRYPSVGATENLILAAVLADGFTCIKGAAREPEIEALCDLLRRMGASIRGDGTSTITILGVDSLHEAAIEVIPDRIVAGTYLCLAAACGGKFLMKRAPVSQLCGVLPIFQQMGLLLFEEEEGLRIIHPGHRLKTLHLTTGPYPGFPTDLQSPLLAALCVAEGTGSIRERVFEDRFKVVEELEKMGAGIVLSGRRATVNGVGWLMGADLCAKDLRGGAALCVAAAAARGKSRIYGYRYVVRGYENMIGDLKSLGIVVHLEKSD